MSHALESPSTVCYAGPAWDPTTATTITLPDAFYPVVDEVSDERGTAIIVEFADDEVCIDHWNFMGFEAERQGVCVDCWTKHGDECPLFADERVGA